MQLSVSMERVHIGSGGGGIISTPSPVPSPTGEQVTGGEELAQYDCVYGSTTDGKFYKATNGTAATADAIGIVIQPGGIAQDGVGNIVLSGPITNSAWSWTKNANLFVSDVAGELTETVPDSLGVYAKPIAFVVDPDRVYVISQLGWRVSGG
jgi:hypothetical protein